MNYVFSLLMLLVVAAPAAAAARTLSLEQAVAMAVEKNRDIAKAGEYAKYVQGKYVDERSAALPQVSLNGSFAALRDGGLPPITGGGSTQYDSAVGVSLSQPLYTWGNATTSTAM